MTDQVLQEYPDDRKTAIKQLLARSIGTYPAHTEAEELAIASLTARRIAVRDRFAALMGKREGETWGEFADRVTETKTIQVAAKQFAEATKAPSPKAIGSERQ